MALRFAILIRGTSALVGVRRLSSDVAKTLRLVERKVEGLVQANRILNNLAYPLPGANAEHFDAKVSFAMRQTEEMMSNAAQLHHLNQYWWSLQQRKELMKPEGEDLKEFDGFSINPEEADFAMFLRRRIKMIDELILAVKPVTLDLHPTNMSKFQPTWLTFTTLLYQQSVDIAVFKSLIKH